jgi:hypothetical protein
MELTNSEVQIFRLKTLETLTSFDCDQLPPPGGMQRRSGLVRKLILIGNLVILRLLKKNAVPKQVLDIWNWEKKEKKATLDVDAYTEHVTSEFHDQGGTMLENNITNQ